MGRREPRRDEDRDELDERVIDITRVAKVVKGGRRFAFRAVVVVGDNKGQVGIGVGKARGVPDSIRKASERARRNMERVSLSDTTIPHQVTAKHGGAVVMLKPASPGTGVIAGGGVRAVLEAAGVPPASVMLCHMDRNPDLYVHRALAARGAYLQYDTPSRIKYQPEHLVVNLMRDMFDAGYGERILLGGDMARRSYWVAYGGGPGFDYLLRSFTPRLRAEGFTDAELELIWHHNPVRWLTAALPS